MRRRLLIGLGIAGLLVAGIGFALRSDPKTREIRRIQGRLLALASAVSFTEKDSPFQKLAYADRVAKFFGTETKLDVSVGTQQKRGTLPRAELQEFLGGMRVGMRGLAVEFLDITPNLESDLRTGVTHLTARIYVKGEPDYWVQELKLQLEKVGGEWFVEGVTTVKTMEQ